MAYATTTEVPVERSKAQIEALLMKYGAQGYHTGWQAATPDDPGWDAVEFMWKGKVIRFRVPRPSPLKADGKSLQPWATDRYGWKLADAKLQKAIEQQNRSRWRVLFLVIKAKLEAVEAGVSIFEDEFLSFIVTNSGRTVGEILLPRLAATGQLQLEAGSNDKDVH
jgi:hypothetical protein